MADQPAPLDLRTGLPDALQVLLKDYPREGWTSDPGFNHLISFWLERHMLFRKLLDMLAVSARARLDGNIDPNRFRNELSRFGSIFVGELHTHHSVEDMHYFPVLAGKDARVAAGFEMLDRDHHALDGYLSGFEDEANAAIQVTDADTAPIGRFEEGLVRLSGFIDRHLTDEEELVVPVILKYGVSEL